MDCTFAATGRERPGEREYRCVQCGFARWSKYEPRLIHRHCSAADSNPEHALESALPEPTRKLVGDRLKELFAAVGIPACGGCDKRAAWLNRVDAWVRDNVIG
jgi:hypothetical protein